MVGAEATLVIVHIVVQVNLILYVRVAQVPHELSRWSVVSRVVKLLFGSGASSQAIVVPLLIGLSAGNVISGTRWLSLLGATMDSFVRLCLSAWSVAGVRYKGVVSMCVGKNGWGWMFE